MLVDKMFSANGEFRYDDAGHTGLWGDVVLVNGVPWPNLKVKKRLYRFRVLNASISRGYRLQLSNSAAMSVIGTDGGLMPQVQNTTRLRVGMAERYEIVIDFSSYKPGTKLQLLNLGVPNSTDFDNTGKIMQFEVVGDASDPENNALPTATGLYSLNPNKEVWDLKENAIQGTTKIEVVRQGGEWKISSTSTSNSGSGSSGGSGSGSTGGGTTRVMTWEDIVASGYKETVANPRSGDVQIWEITNKSGGWFHPVHIHLVDFKMLTVRSSPGSAAAEMWHRGGVSDSVRDTRDRDPAGRARNARPRDEAGRPLPRGAAGVERVPDDLVLPPEETVREAQRLLDAGRPFHAHEVLEAAWKAAGPDERELWRGLAQVAVGLTHLQRGNARGAVALLHRGADNIARWRVGWRGPVPGGVAVEELVRRAEVLAARVEHDGAAAVTPDDLRPRLRA